MSPFRELDHTADLAYTITGRSLEELFTDAAKAWLNSVVEIFSFDNSEKLELTFSADTYESLMVNFLSELNYLLSAKKKICYEIVFLKINEENEKTLSVTLNTISTHEYNCRILEDIKAVTYHQLEIIHENSGFSTNIIFDI